MPSRSPDYIRVFGPRSVSAVASPKHIENGAPAKCQVEAPKVSKTGAFCVVNLLGLKRHLGAKCVWVLKNRLFTRY